MTRRMSSSILISHGPKSSPIFEEEDRNLPRSASSEVDTSPSPPDDPAMADHLTNAPEEVVPDDMISVVGGEIVEGSERRRVRFERREARLHKFRLRNFLTRALVRRQRNGLRQSREMVSTTFEELFALIRDRNSRQERLDQLAKDLQVMRDEHSHLDEEYMVLEDQLDTEEWEIMKLEKQIYRYHNAGNAADISDVSSQSSGTTSSSAVSDPSVLETTGNFLIESLLSHQGDAELIRERHLNLLNEHAYLRDSHEVRQQVGLELAPDDLAIFNAFPARQAELLKEFHEVNAEIKRLRDACRREGLLGDNDSDADSEMGIELQLGSISIPSISHHSLTAPPVLPVVLQDHPPSMPPSPPPASRREEARANNIRVSSWLLQKLRSSSSEVELLKRFSNSLGPIQDETTWREKVISHWYIDGAGLPLDDDGLDLDDKNGPRQPSITVAEIVLFNNKNGHEAAAHTDAQTIPQPLLHAADPLLRRAATQPTQASQTLLTKIISRTSVGIKLDFGLHLQSMRPRERRAMTL